LLRDYQAADVAALSPLVRDHRTVFYQLPTGAGKTAMIAEITSTAFSRGFRVWFVVPRNELLLQASEHFAKWKVPHGIIAAGKEEIRAFQVHVVSKDTLLRRLHRVKNWPDFLIFDEGHLYYDAQQLIIASLPAKSKVLGISATPERLDGRGLGEIYETIHYGPSIPWLTERAFLSPLRYFAPPIAGLESIHRRGTEYDADELESLLEKRKVYGDVIRYYQKYGTVEHRGISRSGAPTIVTGGNYHRGKPALIFCRSVKSAYETAERFTQAGYLFFCIEGNMRKGERERLIEALRKGEIDGLTNCDLATYGLDIPRVEYGASIRPTLSRSLYFQMVGRILRPFDGKDEALFFDHANLVEEHTDISAPGIPLFYLPSLTWNFSGTTRRERAPADQAAMRLCPLKDYQYCSDPACAAGCRLDPDAANRRGALATVDIALEERTPAKKWSELVPGEKREIQDRIGAAVDEWERALEEDPPRIAPGAIGELLRIAEELDRSPMWVYHFLNEKDEEIKASRKSMTVIEYRRMVHAVNVPLLYEIARQAKTKDGKPYARGWAWYKKQELEEQMEKQRKALPEFVWVRFERFL
jgi:DNA repair protein RadD